MARNKITSTGKVKKKKWYPIFASKSFNEQILGESLLTEAEKLKDRYITINLSLLTRSFRDQNVSLLFKVDSVKENKGYTNLIGYNILPSFIKKFVRRDKSKVADSFIAKDKNGMKIRIKPLIITLNIASRSQRTEIRRIVKKQLKSIMEKTTLDDFVTNLIKKDIQRKLKSIIKKVMPIRHAEIRVVKYESLKYLGKQEILNEEIVEELKQEDNEAEAQVAEVVAEEKKPVKEVKAEAEAQVAEVVAEEKKPVKEVKAEEEPVEEIVKEPAKEEVKEGPAVEEVIGEEVEKSVEKAEDVPVKEVVEEKTIEEVKEPVTENKTE
jgi:ribosomal protein S3AE